MVTPAPTSWWDILIPLLTGAASLTAVYFIWQLLKAGALKRIFVKKVVLGPYVILYKTTVGPYSNTNKHFCVFRKQLHDMGLVHPGDAATITTVGFFYDNPKHTPGARCRAAIGYVFKQGAQVVKPEDLAKHRDWLSNLSAVKSGEMKVGVFPASRCLAVCHPLTGWLSILVAIMRVYPRLDQAFNKALKEAKPGIVTPQLQGSLEVYLWSKGNFWVAYPLSARTDLLPFDLPPQADTSSKLKAQ